MAQHSSIEWTEATWNPVTGCTKVSAGCKHCYAKRMAERLQAMGQERYRNGFAVTLQPDLLDLPLHWKVPKRIFVNSMSDLFHEKVPDSYILACFKTMNRAHWHIFQVLTKRHKRLVELAPDLPWSDNIWMGVSVENQKVQERIDYLRQVEAHVRFLSLEPLLGPLPHLNLEGIHWVIVGGESGPKARPIREEWVQEIRAQCSAQKVAFFFKQWGGVNKKATGRLLEGRTWDEYPQHRFALQPALT